jgi:hypothetical protein
MKRLIAALTVTLTVSPAIAQSKPEPTISCVGTCTDLERKFDRDCDFVMALDGDGLQVWGVFPFDGTYTLWSNPVPGYADADRTEEASGTYYRMYIKQLAGLVEIERSKLAADGSKKVAERFKGMCRKADRLF